MIASLVAPADARDGDAPAPWSETPCNDVCEWWMHIGAHDAPAAPPKPQPTPQALMPVDLTPPTRQRARVDLLAKPEPSKPRGGPPGRPRTSPVADVPKPGPPADAASGWGVPLRGSVAILPAAFEAAH